MNINNQKTKKTKCITFYMAVYNKLFKSIVINMITYYI